MPSGTFTLEKTMRDRWNKFFLAALFACLVFLSGVLFAVRAARASAPEPFQYKCIVWTANRPESQDLQGALNREAQGGWRLVSVSSFTVPDTNGTGNPTTSVATVLVFERK
jgi:hypothetical protein